MSIARSVYRSAPGLDVRQKTDARVPSKGQKQLCCWFQPVRNNITLARDSSLWDIASRKKTWRAHPFSNPSDAAFSPKGDMIAVKSTSGQIVTLTWDSGEVRKDF
jgi:hypothetical protein